MLLFFFFILLYLPIICTKVHHLYIFIYLCVWFCPAKRKEKYVKSLSNETVSLCARFFAAFDRKFFKIFHRKFSEISLSKLQVSFFPSIYNSLWNFFFFVLYQRLVIIQFFFAFMFSHREIFLLFCYQRAKQLFFYCDEPRNSPQKSIDVAAFVLRQNSLSTPKTNRKKFLQISVLNLHVGLNILQLPLKDRLIHHNQLGIGDFIYFTLLYKCV